MYQYQHNRHTNVYQQPTYDQHQNLRIVLTYQRIRSSGISEATSHRRIAALVYLRIDGASADERIDVLE